MLILAEVGGLNKYLIHFFGIIYILGRISHAYGIAVAEVKNRNFKYRVSGMICTFSCLAILALILVVQFVVNG
jgi:uncharacterized membrane protein YecN with MAPEG domain